MSFRLADRIAQNDVVRPTTIHAVKGKTLTKDEAAKYLDKFLDEYDQFLAAATDSKYEGPKVTVVSQLKRMQREFRGLPPLVPEVNEDEGFGRKTDFSDVPMGKKTVFEEPSGQKTVFDDEVPKNDEDYDEIPKYTAASDSEEDSSDSGPVIDAANPTENAFDEDVAKSTIEEAKEEAKEEEEAIEVIDKSAEEDKKPEKKRKHKHEHKHGSEKHKKHKKSKKD